MDKYGSVELDNKGSVARDHLALGAEPFYSKLFILSLSILDWSARTILPNIAHSMEKKAVSR